METSLPAILFSIGWLHCLIVVWFAVSIETQSTGSKSASALLNSSEFGSTAADSLPSTPLTAAILTTTTTAASIPSTTKSTLLKGSSILPETTSDEPLPPLSSTTDATKTTPATYSAGANESSITSSYTTSTAATTSNAGLATSSSKATSSTPSSTTSSETTSLLSHTTSAYGERSSTITFESSENQTNPDRSIQQFVPIVCPPPNNLHLLCDVTLDKGVLTCVDRAIVIEACLKKTVYNDSQWDQCLLESNYCEEIYNVLNEAGFVSEPATTGTATTQKSTLPSVITKSTPYDVINVTLSSVNVTINERSTSIIPTSSTSQSNITEGKKRKEGKSSIGAVSTANMDDLGTGSYVYPLIGVGFIVIEVIILTFIFCCYRKSPSILKRKRRQSENSLVHEEEMIEVEAAKPTQALYQKPEVYDDEAVVKEDKNIYRSYLNFPYIDDESKENTPTRSA